MQDRDALLHLDSDVSEIASPSTSEDFVTDLLTNSYKQRRPGLGEMRHGTEGWQALETSFVVCHPISASIISAHS